MPQIAVTGHGWEIRLAGWSLGTVVISTLSLILAIIYNVIYEPHGWLGVVTTCCIILLPIVISILIAPRQISHDQSHLARKAVYDLLLLNRAQRALGDDLIQLSYPNEMNQAKIVIIQDELKRQNYTVARIVSYWREISPTVVDDVLDEEAKILSDMEKLNKSKDQS